MKFLKDYSVKPDNDITFKLDNDRKFKLEDSTFSAQLLLSFSFFSIHRLSLARKKLDICHL